jgi:hypothetical protein
VAARHNGDDLARKARTHRLLPCLVEDAVLYLDDLTQQDHAYFVGTAGAWSKQLGLLLVAALCERGRGHGATSSEGELAGKGRDLVTRHAVHWPWEPQDGQARARAARQALGVLTDLRLAAVGEHRGPASGPPRIATRPSRGHPLSWSAQRKTPLSRWTSKSWGETWRWVPCIHALVRDAAMHAGEQLPADGRRARSLRGRARRSTLRALGRLSPGVASQAQRRRLLVRQPELLLRFLGRHPRMTRGDEARPEPCAQRRARRAARSRLSPRASARGPCTARQTGGDASRRPRARHPRDRQTLRPARREQGAHGGPPRSRSASKTP